MSRSLSLPGSAGPLLSRRAVLRLLALGGATVATAGCLPGGGSADAGGSSGPSSTVAPLAASSAIAAEAARRTLVVVELGGGNDGLSTLAPVGLGRYHDLRPHLALTAEEVVELDGVYGLHQALAPVAARLAVVQGVGVRSPDLSHFAMSSRWWRGDAEGDRGYETGFLGRCCDLVAGDEIVTGITLGAPSPAMIADRATTMSLADLDTLGALGDETSAAARAVRNGWITVADGEGDGAPDSGRPAMLATARSGLRDGVRFVDLLRSLPEPSQGYPETGVGLQFALASRLLRADAGVRILHLPVDGFDTHDGQRWPHDNLLDQLGQAIAAFLNDLDGVGRAGEVLVATTSEFGRRVTAPGSGTDHGGASVALLAGPVAAGRHGDAPSLDALDRDDNLVASTHLDDYYATLAGWLGIPAEEVLPSSASAIGGIVRA